MKTPQGITLREWLAGQALAGLLATEGRVHTDLVYGDQHTIEFNPDSAGINAVRFADGVIRALNDPRLKP